MSGLCGGCGPGSGGTWAKAVAAAGPALWSEGAGETLKAQGRGMLDGDRRIRLGGRVWLSSKTRDVKGQSGLSLSLRGDRLSTPQGPMDPACL